MHFFRTRDRSQHSAWAGLGQTSPTWACQHCHSYHLECGKTNDHPIKSFVVLSGVKKALCVRLTFLPSLIYAQPSRMLVKKARLAPSGKATGSEQCNDQHLNTKFKGKKLSQKQQGSERPLSVRLEELEANVTESTRRSSGRSLRHRAQCQPSRVPTKLDLRKDLLMRQYKI